MTQNSSKKPRAFKFSMYWMYAIILLFLAGIFYLDDNSIVKDVNFTKFENIIEEGGASEIIVFTNKGVAEAVLTDSMASALFDPTQYKKGSNAGARIAAEIPSADKLQDKIDRWQAEGVFTGEVKYEKSSDFSSLLWTFGPVVLLIAFWFFIMKRMSGRDGGAGGEIGRAHV